MSTPSLRLLILGAHPDDAEFHAGALAIRYRRRGDTVRMVSVTNGAGGHHRLAPQELTRTRRAEAAASGELIGAEYHVWDFPDGALFPTLELRHRIIEEIRTFRPDLVVTHRTNDYHPDHRAVGQAVQDASYLVTVPLVVPDVPFLKRDPVVAYMADLFTKPCPLEPDIVFDIADDLPMIVRMLACHQSQFFDFLPFNHGVELPDFSSEEEALTWLRQWIESLIGERADRFRDKLIAEYGEQAGRAMQWIEAYEISEYAASLDQSRRNDLFAI